MNRRADLRRVSAESCSVLPASSSSSPQRGIISLRCASGPINSHHAVPCFRRRTNAADWNITFHASRSSALHFSVIGNRGDWLRTAVWRVGGPWNVGRRVCTAFANEWWRSTPGVLIDQTCRHNSNEVCQPRPAWCWILRRLRCFGK